MFSIIRKQTELLQFCERHMNDELLPVKGLIVSNGHKKVDNINGVPVIELDDVVFERGDGVIISVDQKYVDEIYSSLLNRMREEDVVYNQELYNCYLWDPKEVSIDSRHSGFFKDYITLQQYGEEEQTDKAGTWHNFCNKYELFMQHYREKEFTFVELGVFRGGSIRMWRRYFSKALIYGVDFDERCKEYASKDINILIRDLSDMNSLDEIADLAPSVVVDDASHKWSHQIKAIMRIFKALPSGGIYILEDIHTSFLPLRSELPYADQRVSAYDFIEAVASVVTGNNHYKLKGRTLLPYIELIEELAVQIEMMSFIAESVIIIKR